MIKEANENIINEFDKLGIDVTRILVESEIHKESETELSKKLNDVLEFVERSNIEQ